MGIKEFKVRIKNCRCYYFDDIIKSKDFDFGNSSIDEKSHENILIYGNVDWCKTIIRFDRIN